MLPNWPALLGVALALAGCAPALTCGEGTERKQLADGSVACVAVAVARGDTSCDADGGVQLVAGSHCVSRVQCGPGTTLDPVSLTCLPAAQLPHEPAPCPPPSTGFICVNGTLRHFVDGSFLSGETVGVALYDPQAFLAGANAPALTSTQTGDTFVFPNVATPSSGFVLVVTSDASGQPSTFARVGIGGVAQDGRTLRVDGYVLTRAQVSTWSTAAGSDFAAAGALVYRFFDDPPPPTNARTPTETHPVAGVQLVDGANAKPVASARYFAATLATLDPSLTATSGSGGAIVSASGIQTFTGQGGGVARWEAHQALPVAGLVQIDAFHPQ